MRGEAGVLAKQGINAYNIAVLCCLGFGSLTYGYTASIIGTTLGQPSFTEYFQLDTREGGTDLLSATNGLFQTGGVIGTLCLPWIADKYGRKWACAVSAALAVISGAALAGSVNIGMFLVFRFVAGASAFMILAAIPIMMNEIVPVHLRGALVDLHAVFLVLGYVIQAWTGFAFHFWTGGGLKTWRPPIAIQCVFPVIFLVLLPFIPESPRWLCLKGRYAEAERVLLRLHAKADDPNNDAARAEFYQVRKQIEIDKVLGNSWIQVFKKPSYRKRAFLSMAVTGIIQCSGVLVVNNYGPSIYARLGYDTTSQLMIAALWLTVGWICVIIGMFIVDRFPRPKYIAFGVLGCETALIVEAALVANFGQSDDKAAFRGAVAMLFVFVAFYSMFPDGAQFSYIAEIFPTHLRAKGVCLGVSMLSLLNILWLQVAPTAFGTIGWKFYLCFIIPDTNGLPLEEIAALFGDADEVAIYQRDLVIDNETHEIKDTHQPQAAQPDKGDTNVSAEHAESASMSSV